MAMFSFIFKKRSVKMKVFSFITLILVVYLIVSYVLLEKWYNKSQKEQKFAHLKQTWNMSLQYVVVHFDLKGSPPLLSYLKSILKQLKDHGTTALLVEYEDMFPFEGSLVNLTARNCYKKDELKQFLTSAAQIGLEVIPLVQTFGHLEFALKLREFQHLREDPKFPDSICPSKQESQDFLTEMLRQVIQFHNTVTPLKHIHIGCDEVYQMKVCEICFKKTTKLDIFLAHIKFLSEVVRDLTPKTKILVWDDMFRKIKPTQSIDLRFHNMESVCWDYKASDLDTLHPALYKYQRMFDNQWVAAAFKGADGPTRTLPIMYRRFVNHLNWLNFIMTYEGIYKLYRFKGIILTGWSRYSHLESPCELLPVAIPSLLLNLILIEKYHKGITFRQENVMSDEEYDQNQLQYIDMFIANDLNSALMCQNCIVDGSLPSFQAQTCVFDGSDLYVVLEKCNDLRKTYIARFFGGHDTDMSVELNMDNIKKGYVNMVNVKSLMDMCVLIMQQMTMIETQMIDAMAIYFDKFVIAEYVNFKISKMKGDIHELMQYMSDYYVVKDWPRRPANLSNSWLENIERDFQSQY